MPSLVSYTLRYYLHYLKRKNKDKPFHAAGARRFMDRAGSKVSAAAGVTSKRVSARGVQAAWLDADGFDPSRILLYLHGGAYVSGSIRSHQNLLSHISQAMGHPSLIPDYRLAPEHPFPAAIEDALLAYEWLIHQYPEAEILVGGDSAGGGLAAASVLKIKEEGLKMPQALILLSPWLDMSLAHSQDPKMDHKDPMIRSAILAEAARLYCPPDQVKNPFASPLWGDVQGFPPTLLHVGELEVLLKEAEVFADSLKEARVTLQWRKAKNMVHVWHFFYDRIPEARQAVQEIGDFVKNLPTVG